MEPSRQTVLDAIHATQEMVSRRPELTADDVRRAVADGLREAVADPELWRGAYVAMHERAQKEAGGWLLGGLRALASRAAWLLLAAAAIYMLGGWHGLVAFVKTGGKA